VLDMMMGCRSRRTNYTRRSSAVVVIRAGVTVRASWSSREIARTAACSPRALQRISVVAARILPRLRNVERDTRNAAKNASLRVKPANMLLGEFGEVYVLDWGVARTVDEQPTRALAPHTLDEAGRTAGVLGFSYPASDATIRATLAFKIARLHARARGRNGEAPRAASRYDLPNAVHTRPCVAAGCLR
jgi:hypothetical protein